MLVSARYEEKKNPKCLQDATDETRQQGQKKEKRKEKKEFFTGHWALDRVRPRPFLLLNREVLGLLAPPLPHQVLIAAVLTVLALPPPLGKQKLRLLLPMVVFQQ